MKQTTDENKEAISITLVPMILRKVKEIAAIQERSISWMINRILAQALGFTSTEDEGKKK